MGVRARQWLIAVVGAVLTVAMLWLGLWQMRVFEDKENESAAARATQPAVPLLDFVTADGTVGDIYGKPASVTGHYLPAQQARVLAEDGTIRVLTAFEVADGRVLAVVRGRAAGRGDRHSRAAGRRAGAVGHLPAVRAGLRTPPTPAPSWGPCGCRRWPSSGPSSCCRGSSPCRLPIRPPRASATAVVALPSGAGSIQNIGYALQWWVFAAFGAFMTVRFVRALGRDGSLGTLAAQEEE